MSDNKVNIKKPENYTNFFERKSKIENKKMIENNMIRLKKFLQNKTNKRKRRKEGKKSGSVSSLSNSSHVSSDSSISYGGRKGTMRRKRNGGKTTKRRMKK